MATHTTATTTGTQQKTETNVGDGKLDTKTLDGRGSSGFLNNQTNVQPAITVDDVALNARTSELAVDNSNSNSGDGIINTERESSTTTNCIRNAFETKVKQISKNLKETTLAETGTTLGTNTAASSSSTSTSSSTTPEYEEQTALDAETSISGIDATDVIDEAGATSSRAAAAMSSSAATNLSNMSGSESLDEQDTRSKKVRFHPDVKENDGGNRVKKKKLKASADDSVPSCSRSATGIETVSTDCEMDLDETDEEEAEFDLAKTIAEADDYLKEHPLTFARPHEPGGERLRDGLLDADDMPQLSDSSDDEELHSGMKAENGVERVLGKHTRCGKVEYLLRYVDRAGLFWEPEQILVAQCPKLLKHYEQNREGRQERLMRHVAKRQNIRQRYTDF